MSKPRWAADLKQVGVYYQGTVDSAEPDRAVQAGNCDDQLVPGAHDSMATRPMTKSALRKKRSEMSIIISISLLNENFTFNYY